jgi:hypothetical protein
VARTHAIRPQLRAHGLALVYDRSAKTWKATKTDTGLVRTALRLRLQMMAAYADGATRDWAFWMTNAADPSSRRQGQAVLDLVDNVDRKSGKVIDNLNTDE